VLEGVGILDLGFILNVLEGGIYMLEMTPDSIGTVSVSVEKFTFPSFIIFIDSFFEAYFLFSVGVSAFFPVLAELLLDPISTNFCFVILFFLELTVLLHIHILLAIILGLLLS
jgi:hypothetical protein